MLPEAGATELIFLAAVALIVVGPKDLPVLMRKVGQWVGKMRGLAAEFRSSFDELARQSELDELRKEVEALRNTRIPDPLAEVHSTLDEVNSGLNSGFSIGDYENGRIPPETEAAEAEPQPAAKPRAPRKAKTDTADTAEATPKPKRKAPAKAAGGEPKPRARRASAAVEAKG